MSQKSNKEIVETFEEEFKNKENLNIVDDLMSSNFVHHIKIPNIEPGPAGMKQVGSFVFSQISDIRVTIDFILEGSDFAVSKISATGKKKSDQSDLAWTETNIYKINNGKIVEWWDEGGPPL